MYPSSGECELSILIFRQACYKDFYNCLYWGSVPQDEPSRTVTIINSTHLDLSSMMDYCYYLILHSYDRISPSICGLQAFDQTLSWICPSYGLACFVWYLNSNQNPSFNGLAILIRLYVGSVHFMDDPSTLWIIKFSSSWVEPFTL